MAEQEREKPEDKIELTLNELLTNPTGKSSAFMSARYRIIEDLELRYARMRKKFGMFDYKVFKKGKSYIFVFKVPSETVDGILFDVAVQFDPDGEESVKDRTLNRYVLKLFSNSPNFVFTYAYVLNKSDMIVPFLIDKLHDKVLTEAPKIRNPVETYGFEKSCYFACLFIREMKLTNKFTLDSALYLFNETKVSASIRSDEGKMKEYNMAKARNKEAKKGSRKAGGTARKAPARKKAKK